MKDKKEFDAVKMMRELRAAVDKELEGKSFAEQRRYIEERVQLKGKRNNEIRQQQAG